MSKSKYDSKRILYYFSWVLVGYKQEDNSHSDLLQNCNFQLDILYNLDITLRLWVVEQRKL
jgi:hypothetical protein